MLKHKENDFVGVFNDMTNDEYHAHVGSYSRSALMAYNKSPYHFWSKYLDPDRPDNKSTKALDIGEAFHNMILEPHLFEKNFYIRPESTLVKPEKMLLKEVGREKFESYKEKHTKYELAKWAEDEAESKKEAGKIKLPPASVEIINAQKKALMKDDRVRILLEGAAVENSFFWKDEDTGLIVKCRPDALLLDDGYVIDLKTTVDASPEEFSRSIYKYGYHMQAAMMLDGIEAVTGKEMNTFLFICVEKTHPFCVGLYYIDEDAIEAGRREYKKSLAGLKESLIKDKWPGYEPQAIGLPQWALNRLQQGV